jgi:hypothetical protein
VDRRCHRRDQRVADIVQSGPPLATSEGRRLTAPGDDVTRKSLISLTLLGWLAALDDFRNWLIREAA